MLEVKHRGLLMIALMAVTVIQLLDMTICNVALPHMQSSLGASLESIGWVLTSFIIAGVMVTPAIGWLSDKFGSRRVYLLAVVGFLVSSMLCGAATSLAQMVLFRALQGISSAFIGSMSQTIMFDINPPSKQSAAMSLWGMVTMVAPISGPILGGFLTDTFNWRWIFYINIPLGIPTLLVLFWLLPSRPITTRKLDRFGFLALALCLVALQLMLDRGQHLDWFNSPEIIMELVICLAALWIFMVHTLTTKNPLFPPGLLRNPNFLGGVLCMFIMGTTNIAISSVMPIMFQSVYQYSAVDTGLLLMPRGFGVIVTMLIANRLMGRVDVRKLLFCGFMIASVSLWLMSQWSLEMGWSPILIANFIQGLGLGLIFMPMNMAAFSTLEPQYRPDGSSLLNLMRNLGGSFGISAILTFLARNHQTSHSDLSSHITSYNQPGFDPASTADRFAEMGSAALLMIDAEINRQALMIAYIDNYHLMAIAIFFVALGTLLLKPIRLASTPAAR